MIPDRHLAGGVSLCAINPLRPPCPVVGDTIWNSAEGAAAALALADLAQNLSAPLIVVCDNTAAMDQWTDELCFFLGDSSLIRRFPDWETLPYDQVSPSSDIISDRLRLLSALPAMKRGVVLTTVAALMHRLPPPAAMSDRLSALRVGMSSPVNRISDGLRYQGYHPVRQVSVPGDMTARGSLIDFFPVGGGLPCRVEFDDEQIESLRLFDPETQMSVKQITTMDILPATEVPLDEAGRRNFQVAWRDTFPGNPMQSEIYRDLSEGKTPSGVEYYLPLFFPATAVLFDYLPPASVLFFSVDKAALARFHAMACARYKQQLENDPEKPLVLPEQLFLSVEDLDAMWSRYPRVWLESDSAPIEAGPPLRPVADEEGDGEVSMATAVAEIVPVARLRLVSRPPVSAPIDHRAADPLASFKYFLANFSGRVLLAADTPGAAEELLDMLRPEGLHPVRCETFHGFLAAEAPLGLVVGALDRGLWLADPELAVLGEPQLFGQRIRQRGRSKEKDDPLSLDELTPGIAVVHDTHGVGRYRGLVRLERDGVLSEFLSLEYAEGDFLYVPVSTLRHVHRYIGADNEEAPWHKLGGSQWERQRSRAARHARDTAAELLAIQARRSQVTGRAFQVNADNLRAFQSAFPFTATPDQSEAVQQIIADMKRDQPMDRLLAGDSGFGKTEVAMNAAFIAIENHCQVAVLAPTTLLSQQHYRNFCDRFADWPVRIAQLSRLIGSREEKKLIDGLNDGSVDIVIGTHKLLHKRLRYKRLGLLVIDEEHRFGVRQKEKLKAMRWETDILSLTATPIPRTLHMALSGLRSLSVLSTAPARRQPVRTRLAVWDDALLRDVLSRELQRGGQAFFVHNRVETIADMTERVRALLPGTDVRYAHGRMSEVELERVMIDFYHRRFPVLVCTTIIENGIDIPTANTLIVDQAHRFGLAQLYQLRGRVGRSHRHAWAYFLTPPPSVLPAAAARRLRAIAALDSLGVGFTLAMNDMEIRGTGSVFGEDQSGHIIRVGYGTYLELLRQAVVELDSGSKDDYPFDGYGQDVDVDLGIPALFPQDYVPDMPQRLRLYRKMAAAGNEVELAAFRREVVDRFGKLPAEADNLLSSHLLRFYAAQLGIRDISFHNKRVIVQFDNNPAVSVEHILTLVRREPDAYRLTGTNRISIACDLPPDTGRIRCTTAMLEKLRARAA